MHEKAEAWLKAAGAIRAWQKLPGKGPSGGRHQAGTCRMGDDPRVSVVETRASCATCHPKGIPRNRV